MPRNISGHRFVVLLAAIALLGVGLRVWYVISVTQHDRDLYDATYYELQAESIVNGGGFFNDPFLQLHDPVRTEPAADHPPLTVIALLPAATLDSQHASNLAMRFTMVLFGAGTIVVVGLLGRTLAGPTTGLVAAAIAALDPNLWMNDGLVMSESLAVLLTAGLLLGVYQLRQRGANTPRVAVLGLLAALACLTRVEFAIFLLALVLPAVYVASADRDRRRLMGATVAAFALALAPWCVFNVARFERFDPISTNGGLATRAANCDATYYGSRFGYIDVLAPCAAPNPGVDQSVWDGHLRTEALDYLRGHLSRLPVVALARLGRAWNLFHVGATADISAHEGRPTWASWLGAVATWLLLPLALVGAFQLRRRGERTAPLLVTIVVSSAVIALLVGGLVRYRAPAEPAVIVLAAAAITAMMPRRVAA